ncbi:hypothetical protein Taro_048470 [Colocasia esculenta]|uniref:Uncharacterized protein n=1 Tax=Colocasia esculenta TaxID=4460 RepID=A0A843X877_COLES|nr:hypothetical protein [Colocasia esculenta]
MAFASSPPLPACSCTRALLPLRAPRRFPSRVVVCQASGAEPRNWRSVGSSLVAAAAIVSFVGLGAMPAAADLNKFEAEMRGEFGIGSAAQYGSADLKKAVHVNENFRWYVDLCSLLFVEKLIELRIATVRAT